VSLGNGDVDPELNRTDKATENENHEKAVSILNRKLIGEPDNPEALWRIGLCWSEMGEPEKEG